jgi:tetratricopeptide (TPR) repeat protein
MRKILLLTLCAFCFAVFTVADEGKHHEELSNEQLGTVHFPVSCQASVQKPFERGVALLHSFWYEEAEKQFEQIAKDDPGCAMAHWGVAMSLWHQLWNHPDEAAVAKGLSEVKAGESLRAKTPRERDYIGAMRAFYGGDAKLEYQSRADGYASAMEKMDHAYPEDREARAFYALSLLASEPDGDKTFANRKKAAAILEPLFAAVPNHPGVAHYLIHSYDSPQMAQLGLPAARRYAQIAPEAPHALHMPSHIFARLGLWQDDIDSNLASIAATRKSTEMHKGGEGHQFHAMDFLLYAYLQSGHEADAKKMIDEVNAMAPMKDMYGMGFDPRTSALVSFPARYALELHQWSEAANLQPVPGASEGDSSITYVTRAIGAGHLGHAEEIRKDLAQIETIHKHLLAKNKTEFAKAVEEDHKVAEAWLNYAQGKKQDAIAALDRIAQDQESVAAEVGAIPAREMAADILLEMKEGEKALAEYQADLKFNPGRFNALYGAAQAAEMAGQSAKASEYYAMLLKSCVGSSSDRPELARAKSLVASK